MGSNGPSTVPRMRRWPPATSGTNSERNKLCVGVARIRQMGYRTELLKDYHRVFGAAGLALAARSRAMSDPGAASLTPAGARHPVTVRLGTSDISTYREV